MTEEVLKKFGPKIREVRTLHWYNILSMLVTEEVSKDERSRDVKDVHPLNIRYMLVTAEVLNEERSRDVKDAQL